MSMRRSKFRGVWGKTERQGSPLWTKIGHAWEEDDGSISAQLHAFPLSGRMCIKEGEPPPPIALVLETFEEAVQ